MITLIVGIIVFAILLKIAIALLWLPFVILGSLFGYRRYSLFYPMHGCHHFPHHHHFF